MKFTVDRKRLSSALRIPASIADEGRLKFGSAGMHTRVVDPAHVAMVDLDIPRTIFATYAVLEEEVAVVDFPKLSQFLSMPGDDKSVTAETEENRLKLKVGGTTRSMALLSPLNVADPHIPVLNLPEDVSVALEDLRIAIDAISPVADYVDILAEPPDLLFSASEQDSVEHRIPAAGTKTKVKSKFGIDYFSTAVGSLPSGATLRLRFGQEYPLYLDFSLAEAKAIGGAGPAISGAYVLAPRIESD